PPSDALCCSPQTHECRKRYQRDNREAEQQWSTHALCPPSCSRSSLRLVFAWMLCDRCGGMYTQLPVRREWRSSPRGTSASPSRTCSTAGKADVCSVSSCPPSKPNSVPRRRAALQNTLRTMLSVWTSV